MLAKCYSGALNGVDARTVGVEVYSQIGTSMFAIVGSPGSGKTMLARRIMSILPPLTVDEALEVSRIHSVVGLEKGGGRFVTRRPFRAPHHTVSSIGLLGGGTHPVPGGGFPRASWCAFSFWGLPDENT